MCGFINDVVDLVVAPVNVVKDVATGNFGDVVGDITGALPDSTLGKVALGVGGAAWAGGAFDPASFAEGWSPAFEAANAIDPVTGGLIGFGDAVAGGASTASSGGGISGFLSGLSGSKLAGGALTAGLNLAPSLIMANAMQKAAERSAALSDPAASPQRSPYQAMLMNLLNSPQSFLSTDPVIQGQLDISKKAFEAASGVQGSGGTTYNAYLKNLTDVMGGQFDTRVKELSNISGLTQGTGGAGQAYSSLEIPRLNSLANAYGSSMGILGNSAGLGDYLAQYKPGNKVYS